MGYAVLADIVVAFHVAYVSFVIVGQLAIVVGVVRRWEWVRNVWFRWLHLATILIVALEAVAGIACPLTVWERSLRELAGQTASGDSFIGRLLHSVIFYRLPEWVFTATYVGFFLLVLATLWLAPPRRRRRTPA